MSDAYGCLPRLYQPLSKVVFGGDLVEANQTFVAENLGKKIHIIGGGDGSAYPIFGERLQGVFWEKSLAMMQLARENLKSSALEFRHGEFAPSESEEMEVVILPFVLDTLRDEEIRELLRKIKRAIAPRGKLIVSDFYPAETFGQRILEKVMLWFFRWIAQHPRKDIPFLPLFLEKEEFRLVERRTWRKGWFFSAVYSLDGERPK